MSHFTVYSVPGSPFGRSVLMALEEKHAPYRFIPVPLETLRSREHLARHPFGRVPVLDHGTFRLYETQAMLRYLDRVLPEPRLSPSDPQRLARMDQSMNINDWYLFHGVANVIAFQRIVGPKLLGREPDESAIAAAMPKAHVAFAALAGQLGAQPYFTGNDLTLADIILAPSFEFFAQTPEWDPLTADKPNLRSWLERMMARPSMTATTWERVEAMAANAVAA
jgi:glutathione S-transferase